MQPPIRAPRSQPDGATFNFAAQTVLYAIFNQRLQQHAGNQHIQTLGVHLFFKAQLLAETSYFDRKVIFDEVQLVAQRAEVLMLAQQASQDAREFQHSEARRVRIGADQRRDRVQRIEQKVRIDLAGE